MFALCFDTDVENMMFDTFKEITFVDDNIEIILPVFLKQTNSESKECKRK